MQEKSHITVSYLEGVMKYLEDLKNKRFTSPKLDPYRYAARILLNRVKWDITPFSHIHRKRMLELKNSQLEKKAVILCNGPSLLKENLEIIPRNVFTVGLNKINLLFDERKFRVDCIIASNIHVIRQNANFFNDTAIQLFLESQAAQKRIIKHRNNVLFFHSTLMPGFAEDCSYSINPQHTVTNVALQILFHLGVRKVAIIGADHNFAVSGTANALVHTTEDDLSHFSPDYFKNEEWQLPDLIESEVGYLRAKHRYERAGGEVVNATQGGRLEIFRRETLETFIGTK